MHLDMAIRAQKVEPLGMPPKLGNRDATRLDSFGAPIHMVKVERVLTTVIPAPRTPAAEARAHSSTRGPLLVAPVFLFAETTARLPTLVALIPQEDSAFAAKAVAALVNARTDVLFIRGQDLAAIGATQLENASTTVRGLAVIPVGDLDSATLAVQRWVLSHNMPPADYYTTVESQVLRENVNLYGGSGPADFALNILQQALSARGWKGRTVKCWKATCFAAAWDLHQKFKWTFIAPLDRKQPLQVIPWATVNQWLDKELKEYRPHG
jgi:hypothetical protein